ncbi:hypothetical protein [Nostoc sp. 'Peltigera membranacea cyanobiont' 232]|uniref:hypothetical protein n=1 Tax=Nostoc sp. 'Peltigera membranacea cyanobiont' 232 TaxID=2014531 RepID=UPI000B9508DE|nr:hypothetical protein [Nostoc sp. 'Peltigera membranacea cyanobiont' 232]OYE00998.1 hypothetical protein CDG79_31955 [Nostoc sp. 'Peltigera membranacea cyanobiont' 232]
MPSDTSFGFNFNSSNESVTEESLERIEEQCDRQTENYLWGAYKKVENVDCPEPDSSDEELDPDDDFDDEDDFDDY